MVPVWIDISLSLSLSLSPSPFLPFFCLSFVNTHKCTVSPPHRHTHAWLTLASIMRGSPVICFRLSWANYRCGRRKADSTALSLSLCECVLTLCRALQDPERELWGYLAGSQGAGAAFRPARCLPWSQRLSEQLYWTNSTAWVLWDSGPPLWGVKFLTRPHIFQSDSWLFIHMEAYSDILNKYCMTLKHNPLINVFSLCGNICSFVWMRRSIRICCRREPFSSGPSSAVYWPALKTKPQGHFKIWTRWWREPTAK